MRRSWVVLLLFLAASPAHSARAAVPSPSPSTFPSLLVLGASDGTSPDPALAFVVTVRDLANNPIAGAAVVLDLSNCPDILLGTLAGPGTVVDCTSRTARAITDGAGRAEFRLTGSVGAREPSSFGAQGRVYADGVLLGFMRVAVLDQDGAEGVDAKDLSLLYTDLFGGQHPARSDLDGNGSVSVGDLALLIQSAGRDAEQVSAEHCGGGATTRPAITTGVLDLTWDDCPSGAAQSLKTFDCTINVGPSHILVAAATLPDAYSDLLGVEAEIELFSPTVPALPDYWHVEPAGCSSNRAVFSPEPVTGSCDPMWLGLAVGGISRVEWPVGGDPRRMRVRIVNSVPEPASSTGGTASPLFALAFTRSRTVGTGACAGCLTPVAFWLRSVRLVRGVAGSGEITAPDLMLSAPALSSTAFWQQVTGATEAIPTSWGRIKTTYR